MNYKVGSKYSVKIGAILLIIVFIALLVPVLNLADINCATGDDYGYATETKWAWQNTHSIFEVFKASWNTIKSYYSGWQGTWFDIFLFSLQPEAFHEGAYIIVPYIMLFFWCGSTFYMCYQILVKWLKIDIWSYILFVLMFLIMCIEYVPSTRSAVFWYNGAAHYIIPFSMCQMVFAFSFKYIEEYKKRYMIGIIVLMILLGGANYQAAILGVLGLLFINGYNYFMREKKRNLIIIVPIVLELIGLIISMKAPGNKVRGGENFGFSVNKGINTIIQSFIQGIIGIGRYIVNNPLLIVGLLFLLIVSVNMFLLMKNIPKIKCKMVIALGMFCIYCAMYAPAIYADVDVSGGVYNTNYQMCIVLLATWILITANIVAVKIKGSKESNIIGILIMSVGLCVILLFAFRSNVKESTSWKCYEYSSTGRAQIYEKQMAYWKSLLLDENIRNVILPSINDDQGPLMFMPATDDENAFTNRVMKDFYHKDSVIAISRDEWIERYGEPIIGKMPY